MNGSLSILLIVVLLASSFLVLAEPIFAQEPTASPTPSPTPIVTPSPSPPRTPFPSSACNTPAPTTTPTPLPTPSPTPDVSALFKPSVQNFVLYLVNQPFQIPATTPSYTTDPYTGETRLQNPGSSGYQVDNWTIQLWITNSEFKYPLDSNVYSLFYNVRTKGHFEQDWKELYPLFSGLHTGNSYDRGTFIPNACPKQSGNFYTVITYSAYSPPYYTYSSAQYPPDAQVDFQISAVLGHNSTIFYNDHALLPPGMLIGHEEPAIAFDIQGDWSSFQTITISNDSLSTVIPQNPQVTTSFGKAVFVSSQSPTPSPTNVVSTPTPTPTVPEFSWQIILPFLFTITVVFVLIRKRRLNCSI